MFKKRKEIHPSGQIPEINQGSLHTQHSTYTKREALLIGIQRQKSPRAENPATHKRILKKNKTKIKKKTLPTGDSPSLQKYASSLIKMKPRHAALSLDTRA